MAPVVLLRARSTAISTVVPAICRARRPTVLSSAAITPANAHALALPLPRWFAFASWEGRPPEEHVTNRKDELDVQSSASKSGVRERAAGGGGSGQSSVAASQKDDGDQNKKAKEDHPEAPGPVIGMNDERGRGIPDENILVKE
ncbi:hypothetical protein MMC29_008350 [Sticta canariensis]|nr:hypothetical protein [Sticta canariensis]